MYNTQTAVITAEEFTSDYMSAGINDNVTLKEVNVKKSPTDKSFLEIIFENEQGQTASMSEWKNEKNMWIKTDEDLQRRDNAQFGRLLQILKCYYPVIEDVNLSTFVDMINWVKSKLDAVIPTKKKLRLKVVYDKKGYTTISTNGIFVEDMAVEQSQVKKFARDLFERPVQADNEAKADPLASTLGTSTPVMPEAPNGDLPF